MPTLHLKACAVDATIASLLSAGTRETRVHSTFRHAFNCPLEHGLLLAVARVGFATLPGGVFIRRDDWTCLHACGISTGDRVLLGADSIEIPDCGVFIDLRRVPVRRVRRRVDPIASAVEINCRLAAVSSFLGEVLVGVHGSRVDPRAECWHADLREREDGLVAALVSGRASRISAAATNLVGLGPGLTPSGDDFLVGVLLALRLIERCCPPAASAGRLLVAAMECCAGQTTSVSASYLRYAAAGDFAGVPVELACRLISGRDDWILPARRLVSMGATSGLDLAEGIVAGLSAFVDLIWPEVEAELVGPLPSAPQGSRNGESRGHGRADLWRQLS